MQYEEIVSEVTSSYSYTPEELSTVEVTYRKGGEISRKTTELFKEVMDAHRYTKKMNDELFQPILRKIKGL